MASWFTTGRFFKAEKLRWLFAETLVIVLGILIALALEDYRTELSERKLAIEYIQRIQNDVHRDLEHIATVWHSGLAVKRRALESVAPVVRGDEPVPDDIAGFLTNVSNGGILGLSAANWYTDTTFQDMRATGNLRLIKDATIRAEITEYYRVLESVTSRVERRFTGYALFVHSALPAELRDAIDIGAIERFGVDYALSRLLSDDFRNLVNQEFNLLLFMEGREYERYARSLLESLDSYRHFLEGG